MAGLPFRDAAPVDNEQPIGPAQPRAQGWSPARDPRRIVYVFPHKRGANRNSAKTTASMGRYGEEISEEYNSDSRPRPAAPALWWQVGQVAPSPGKKRKQSVKKSIESVSNEPTESDAISMLLNITLHFSRKSEDQYS